MMKNVKKILSGLLVCFMLLSTSIVSFAAEIPATEKPVATTLIELQTDEASPRIPNAIEVAIYDVDSDNVKVSISNFGIDTFDKVSCYVEVWDNSGRKQVAKTITEKDIFPLFPRNNTLYVKNWAKIKVSNIQCWDGDDYGTVINVEYEK